MTEHQQDAEWNVAFIGRHLTFVPLGGIQVGPDELQVAVTQERVIAQQLAAERNLPDDDPRA